MTSTEQQDYDNLIPDDEFERSPRILADRFLKSLEADPQKYLGRELTTMGYGKIFVDIRPSQREFEYAVAVLRPDPKKLSPIIRPKKFMDHQYLLRGLEGLIIDAGEFFDVEYAKFEGLGYLGRVINGVIEQVNIRNRALTDRDQIYSNQNELLKKIRAAQRALKI